MDLHCRKRLTGPASETVADDINRSVIREQVEMGVAVRMAALDALARKLPNEPTAGIGS